MLAWWVICFAATALVVFGKWYFSNNISRIRQILSRQHREALELKGSLQDARAANMHVNRQIKSHEVDITRSRKRISELNAELDTRREPDERSRKGK